MSDGSILKTITKPAGSVYESVWWVFKQLWDKNLVYQGTRVVPFSTASGQFFLTSKQDRTTRCSRPCGNSFKLDNEDKYIAAWITTLGQPRIMCWSRY